MNCNKFKKYIIEYLDGDMPQQDKVSFMTHLETCPVCKERWGYQIRLSERLGVGMKRYKEALEVPTDLLYDILRGIRNIPQPRPYWVSVFNAALRIPAVVYATCILILGVFITYSVISIGNVEKIHPIKILARSRISENVILAHIHQAKDRLTRQLAYSDVRSSFRKRIESSFFIRQVSRRRIKTV